MLYSLLLSILIYCTPQSNLNMNEIGKLLPNEDPIFPLSSLLGILESSSLDFYINHKKMQIFTANHDSIINYYSINNFIKIYNFNEISFKKNISKFYSGYEVIREPYMIQMIFYILNIKNFLSL